MDVVAVVLGAEDKHLALPADPHAEPARVLLDVEVDAGFGFASSHAQAEVELQHSLSRASGGRQQAGGILRERLVHQPFLRGGWAGEGLQPPVGGDGSASGLGQDSFLDGLRPFADEQVVEVCRTAVEAGKLRNADAPAELRRRGLHGLHADVARNAALLRPAVVVGAEDKLPAGAGLSEAFAGGLDVSGVHGAQNGEARSHADGTSRGPSLADGDGAVRRAFYPRKPPLDGKTSGKLLGTVGIDALDALHSAFGTVQGNKQRSAGSFADSAEGADLLRGGVGVFGRRLARRFVGFRAPADGFLVGRLPFGFAPCLRLLHPAAAALHVLGRHSLRRWPSAEPLVGPRDLDRFARLPVCDHNGWNAVVPRNCPAGLLPARLAWKREAVDLAVGLEFRASQLHRLRFGKGFGQHVAVGNAKAPRTPWRRR